MTFTFHKDTNIKGGADSSLFPIAALHSLIRLKLEILQEQHKILHMTKRVRLKANSEYVFIFLKDYNGGLHRLDVHL